MARRILRLKTTNAKRNIVLSMLFPSFLVMVVLVIISSYNFHRNKELAQERCLSSMQLFSQRCENEIMNIVQSSIFLSENTYFDNALSGVADLKNTQAVFAMKNAILNFEEAHPVIHDVVIMDRDDEKVITSGGGYTFDEYFKKIVSYENYTKEYWKSYRPFVSSRYSILSPSAYSSSDGAGAILPIIIFENHNKRFKNLLVVNISIDALIALQNSYLMEDDTKVFLMNNHSGDTFQRTGNETVTENILNTELYENLLNKQFFKYDFMDYGNCLMVTYSTQNNLSGYTYFGAIPYNSIGRIQFAEILICILLFLILAAVTVFYSINNTNRILTPIQKVIGTISQQNVSGENIFEHLELAVSSMQKTNADLYTTFPYAQEKYLINFLNSADYSITEETKEIIKNSLPFKYEYFASVILQTYPTKLFFETYSQAEYANIQSGMHALIKQMFSEKYLAFFLTSEKDVLYVILNTENDEGIENITNVIEEISALLEQDNGYMNVYAGIGGIYQGWEGLKRAHLEAMSNMKYIRRNSPKVVIGQGDYLNDAEISKLYNALVVSDIECARQLIDKYCEKASDDQRWLKQIYTQILSTIFKVMRTRNISYNDNQLDFEVYSNILTKSCAEIYKEIVLLLNLINDAKETEVSVNLGEEIIDYINNNFAIESLSLDMLAEKFKAQPTYISTLVKNTLGVGFHKHLTTLRVSKAKELLTHTNMSIQEIYESCGFCSKPTFFRVFKQDAGVTPSEYRKTQNNKS